MKNKNDSVENGLIEKVILIACLVAILIAHTGCGVTVRADYYGKTEKYDQSGTQDFSKLFGHSKPKNRE